MCVMLHMCVCVMRTRTLRRSSRIRRYDNWFVVRESVSVVLECVLLVCEYNSLCWNGSNFAGDAHSIYVFTTWVCFYDMCMILRHEYIFTTCVCFYDMCVFLRHVHVFTTCVNVYDMCILLRHVHVFTTCVHSKKCL